MPVRILLVLLLVNFSAVVLAQATATQIRGPKSADNAFVQKQFGPLTASDTLWRIAEQVKPNDSVTTYQVMYAIFIKNPDAFNDANFNHLRPGAIMLLPDLREIRSVDPAIAKRKAELDDQSWAERQLQERAARELARVQASRPAPVNEQTQAELMSLREQHQSSLQLLDGVVRENEQLRGTLSQVQQQLELLKQQLAADNALQQELNQIVQQQQAMLAEQEARRQAEEAARLAEASGSFANLLKTPLAMVFAASLPAILALAGVLFWLRRRTKKTEEVVAAATKEPIPTAGYQSPVPPLDNSQDFDDSLFTLDDSLLDEAFEQPIKNSSSQNKVVDDDQLPDFSDDILLDDLDTEDPLKTELLDMAQDESDDLSLDNLDTDLAAAIDVDNGDINLDSFDEISFDAENILSDTDLAALLGGDDSDTGSIELADPEQEQAAREAMTAGNEAEISLTDQDDIDSLLEEIEIDLPAFEAENITETAASEDVIDNTWADDLEAATEGRFEGSELEAFAEELASASAEELSMAPEEDFASFVNTPAALAVDGDDNLSEDKALLQDELDDILQQASNQGMSQPADDELMQGQSQQDQELELEHELEQQIEQEIAPDLGWVAESEPELAMAPIAETEEALTSFTEDISGLDDALSDLATTPAHEDFTDSLNLADESAFVATLLDPSELESEPTAPDLDLDLSLADDTSVYAQTEASLAVENPSALLDDYPELDLTDFDLEADAATEELTQQLADISDSEQVHGSDEAFTDLTAEAFSLDELEQQPFEQLLDELEQATAGAADVELLLEDEQQSEEELSASEPEVDDTLPLLSDADFVEIDNLLSALEQTETDANRFEQLNVDVGLDEFADIIGEHTKMDVDQEDNGYAAKLDLVRAYIEMDEPDSASVLISEILQSDAPEHVKIEAEQLKP